MPEFTAEHLTEATLGAYLDGELDPEGNAQAEVHLKACSQCRSRLESLESLFIVLEGVPDVPLTRDLSGKVVSAVSAPQRWPTRLRTLAIVELLAALTLAAVTGTRVSTTRIPVDLTELNRSMVRLQEGVLDALASRGLTLWEQLTDATLQLQSHYLDLSLPALQAPALWGAVLAALAFWFAGNGVLLRSRLRTGRKE